MHVLPLIQKFQKGFVKNMFVTLWEYLSSKFIGLEI